MQPEKTETFKVMSSNNKNGVLYNSSLYLMFRQKWYSLTSTWTLWCNWLDGWFSCQGRTYACWENNDSDLLRGGKNLFLGEPAEESLIVWLILLSATTRFLFVGYSSCWWSFHSGVQEGLWWPRNRRGTWKDLPSWWLKIPLFDESSPITVSLCNHDWFWLCTEST